MAQKQRKERNRIQQIEDYRRQGTDTRLGEQLGNTREKDRKKQRKKGQENDKREREKQQYVNATAYNKRKNN